MRERASGHRQGSCAQLEWIQPILKMPFERRRPGQRARSAEGCGEAGVTKTTLDGSRTGLACFPLFYSQLGGRKLYLLLWDIRKCVPRMLPAFPTVLLACLHVLFPQWLQIWENTGVLANSAALVT